MSVQVDNAKLAVPAAKKDTQDGGGKEDVFTQWRTRRESLFPSGGNTNRRKSNLKDLAAANMNSVKGAAGLRRLTMTMRAKSDISMEAMKPQVKKENTYKMVPDEEKGFSVARVTRAVHEMLEDELSDLEYDHDSSSNLALELAEKVKDRVKELNFARFKIACNVIIGQSSDQGMEIASRSVWDHKTDNSACISYKTKNLFAIALVFGVYFE